MPNPFRIHGAVAGAFFTDRATEVKRIATTLREPGAKLLLFGERRVGKTSALLAAIQAVRRQGGHGFLVDLSTAASIADAATRVLDGATRGLGRSWRNVAELIARQVSATLTVRPDPATGLLIPSLQVEARRRDVAEQQRTLGQVLDALEEIATRKRVTIGIVIDEIQALQSLGGEQAEWHLRGVMQHHHHLAYVLAGSKPSLLRQMTAQGRAFFGMLDTMAFGPIAAEHLASWIDARLSGAGVAARGIGAECISLAGPRTRDVVQLARKAFDVVIASRRRKADRNDVALAYGELIDEMDDAFHAFWDDASAVQREVLRAVAGAKAGLTTEETRQAFALPASGSVTKAVTALVNERRLVRDETAPSGYTFDNPFFRGWIIREALGDLGLELPETHPPR